MLQIMGAFADFERTLTRERPSESIAAAKAAGTYMRRKPVFDADETEASAYTPTPSLTSEHLGPDTRAL